MWLNALTDRIGNRCKGSSQNLALATAILFAILTWCIHTKKSPLTSEWEWVAYRRDGTEMINPPIVDSNDIKACMIRLDDRGIEWEAVDTSKVYRILIGEKAMDILDIFSLTTSDNFWRTDYWMLDMPPSVNTPQLPDGLIPYSSDSSQTIQWITTVTNITQKMNKEFSMPNVSLNDIPKDIRHKIMCSAQALQWQSNLSDFERLVELYLYYNGMNPWSTFQLETTTIYSPLYNNDTLKNTLLLIQKLYKINDVVFWKWENELNFFEFLRQRTFNWFYGNDFVSPLSEIRDILLRSDQNEIDSLIVELWMNPELSFYYYDGLARLPIQSLRNLNTIQRSYRFEWDAFKSLLIEPVYPRVITVDSLLKRASAMQTSLDRVEVMNGIIENLDSCECPLQFKAIIINKSQIVNYSTVSSMGQEFFSVDFDPTTLSIEQRSTVVADIQKKRRDVYLPWTKWWNKDFVLYTFLTPWTIWQDWDWEYDWLTKIKGPITNPK